MRRVSTQHKQKIKGKEDAEMKAEIKEKMQEMHEKLDDKDKQINSQEEQHKKDLERIAELEVEVKKMILAKYPGTEFLGDPNNKIPGVIGMLIPNIVNEMFIKNMAEEVALSAGSACGISEPSYVITEINKNDFSSNFIRLTLNKYSNIKNIII